MTTTNGEPRLEEQSAASGLHRITQVVLSPGVLLTGLLALYFLYRTFYLRSLKVAQSQAATATAAPRKNIGGMSQPPAPAAGASKPVTHTAREFPKLDPPKDDPITQEELSKCDGTNGAKIYVAIKGKVFDVSSKVDMYGPGAGYHVFTGKDASRALGMSSLKSEDAVADYSTLNESEMKVLDDWVKYFEKRYNIVGKVVESSAKF